MEDATCFTFNAAAGGGFFTLATSAVMLAFTNTLVTRAMTQFFRDTDNTDEMKIVTLDDVDIHDMHHTSNEYIMDGLNSVNWDEDISEVIKKIQPLPVLFTDTFRWILYRQDVMIRERRESSTLTRKSTKSSLVESTADESDVGG